MKVIMLLLLIVFLVIIYLYFGNAVEKFTSPSQTSLFNNHLEQVSFIIGLFLIN